MPIWLLVLRRGDTKIRACIAQVRLRVFAADFGRAFCSASLSPCPLPPPIARPNGRRSVARSMRSNASATGRPKPRSSSTIRCCRCCRRENSHVSSTSSSPTCCRLSSRNGPTRCRPSNCAKPGCSTAQRRSNGSISSRSTSRVPTASCAATRSRQSSPAAARSTGRKISRRSGTKIVRFRARANPCSTGQPRTSCSIRTKIWQRIERGVIAGKVAMVDALAPRLPTAERPAANRLAAALRAIRPRP